MRAGIPQLLSPVFYDQFDNAACLETLGVGRIIRDSVRDEIVPQLQALLTSPDVKDCCARIRSRFDGMAAVERICAIVEGLA